MQMLLSLPCPRRLLLTACLCTTGGVLAQAPPGPLSLTECIRYAEAHNLGIASAQLEAQAAEKYVKEVRSAGLPQVAATGSYQDNLKIPVSVLPAEVTGGEPGTVTAVRFGTKYNATGTVRADQLLYDGAYWAGLKAARGSAEYYQVHTRQQTETVVYQVSRAYYQALVTRKQREIIASNLRSNRDLLRTTELLFGEGLVSQTERDLVLVNYNNVLTQYENAGREAERSLDQLKFQMGMPLATALPLAEVDTTVRGILEGVDTTATAHYTNRLDFKSLQITGDLLRLDLKRIRAGYQPTLGLYFSASTQAFRQQFDLFDEGQPWYNSYFYGLQLSVPLFDGLRKHAQAQQSRLSIKRNETLREQLIRQVALDVANAGTDYAQRFRTFRTGQQNVGLAGKVYADATEAYAQGTGSYNDLVDAETALQQAQTQYISSLLEVYLAKIDLLKAQGKLLDYYQAQ